MVRRASKPSKQADTLSKEEHLLKVKRSTDRTLSSVVLLDLSMPILDGVSATARMREIELMRRQENQLAPQPTRILALTGMSSLEDKRRAFEAGVDG